MPATADPAPTTAIKAQADLHHQLFIGLQLMVITRDGAAAVGDWMFRLFRRQHEAKFLSSFKKLGLDGLPHAVACAKYHVLSNGIGGVAVEYMEEGPRKAWVRFRYPRWMYDGPALCGVPLEASRGFLKGWYAHNGVSLENPRLGFVCVSEDMTGAFGFCGYFQEYDRDLGEAERLQFRPGERPPPFDPQKQPTPPEATWSAERLAKAERNYAVEYIRNGTVTLIEVLGRERAMERLRLAARLTGLQQYPRMAKAVGAVDGGVAEAARFLAAMFAGMDDRVDVVMAPAEKEATLHQRRPHLWRDLDGAARAAITETWTELWRGCIGSHREFMHLDARIEGDGIVWTVQKSRA